MHDKIIRGKLKGWRINRVIYYSFQKNEKKYILETKYVKMAQRGLDIELRKKVQGMEFRDFYELTAKVIEYEKLLSEESQRRKTSMGTYCQEVNFEELAIADLLSTSSFIYPLLMKKAPDL